MFRLSGDLPPLPDLADGATSNRTGLPPGVLARVAPTSIGLPTLQSRSVGREGWGVRLHQRKGVEPLLEERSEKNKPVPHHPGVDWQAETWEMQGHRQRGPWESRGKLAKLQGPRLLGPKSLWEGALVQLRRT